MSLTWKQAIKDFETYLRLEKSLSENSIEAYINDINKLRKYFMDQEIPECLDGFIVFARIS